MTVEDAWKKLEDSRGTGLTCGMCKSYFEAGWNAFKSNNKFTPNCETCLHCCESLLCKECGTEYKWKNYNEMDKI